MVPEEDMCYSCFEATKYSCIKCTNAICNRCSAFESNKETPGWIAGEAVGYCLPCKQEEGIEVKTILIITLSGIVAHLTGQNGEFGGLKCRNVRIK